MDIREFEGLFKPAKRYINLVIMGLCVIIYFADELVYYRTGLPVIEYYGVLQGEAVLLYKEYWRVISYMFLHGSLDHLLNNMLILYFMGNYLERMIGSFRYTFLYVLSGILAAFGSMMINGIEQYCVGASGAIFGVFGAVFFLVVADKLFPDNLRKIDTHMTLRQILIFVVLSVYSGFTDTGVDNAAHVTGLLVGFFLMGVTYFVLPSSKNE